MDNVLYTALSAKTASTSLHPELVDQHYLLMEIMLSVVRLHRLDGYKKALFYGKGQPNDRNMPVQVDPSNADLVHGIIGVATEAGEMLDVLSEHLRGNNHEDLRALLVEELGDLLWYIAMLSRWLSIPISEIMSRNISKLRARYPQGFTEYAAVNRDLSTEQLSFDLDAPP